MSTNCTTPREFGRGNQESTIQRNWQHGVHKTRDEDKQNKNKNKQSNTPPYEKKQKT